MMLTAKFPPTARGASSKPLRVASLALLVALIAGCGKIVRLETGRAQDQRGGAEQADTDVRVGKPLLKGESHTAMRVTLPPLEDPPEPSRGSQKKELPDRRQIALGSGVIIDKSGIVLTNAHVATGEGTAGEGKVVVKLHDGRQFEATDVRTDLKTDLAIMKINNAGDLPAVSLGNSDRLEIGDWVIAVGNPFGLSESVTAGIISAKERGLGIGQQEGFLQTDAAINPGNSGGPLVNLYGQVVGINTAISTTTGGYQGIGFAIPMNVARWVSQELISKGKVTRAYLGISLQELTPDLAQKLGLDKHASGVAVVRVYPNSPAAEAGLKSGDVLVGFADRRITSAAELQEAVQQLPIGSQQRITVLRDGKRVNLNVVVREQPEDFGRERRRPSPQP